MKTLRFFLTPIIAICLLGCTNESLDAFPEDEINEVFAKTELPSFIPEEMLENVVLTQELKRLYRIVENFESEEEVISAGWTESITGYVPGMGYHYANFKEFPDAKFKVHKPEAVLIACTAEGSFMPVGVEYIIQGDPATAPEGFSGEWDKWHYIDGVGWTLHVWLLYENPDGLFNATNSRIAEESTCD